MNARLTRLVVVFVALSTARAAAQVPTMESLRTGTASISGQVADARSGEPLANVTVALTAPKIMGVLSATTDEAGIYRFADLAEHEYQVRVLDPLYLHSCFGATDVMQLTCATVAIVRNQQRTGIDLRLTPTAILRGRVLDDTGRPVGGANVSAQPAPSSTPAGLASGGQTKPDGTFQISLPGGDWVLSLDMPMTADRPRPPAVFYPGVPGIQEAEVIRLSAGLVTSGLEFRFPKIASRSLTTRVSLPAPGASDVRAFLYRVEPRMRREVALDAEGTGTVKGLLEGRYYIAAHATIDGRALAVSDVAHVVQDETEVLLLLAEPGRIKGTVVTARGTLPPLADARVAASWVDDDGEDVDPVGINEAALGSDGSFQLDGLYGLRRLQLAGLPAEWHVQSIRQGRNDIAAAGVTVAPGATADIVITIAQR
jgi:hypothetical protein